MFFWIMVFIIFVVLALLVIVGIGLKPAELPTVSDIVTALAIKESLQKSFSYDGWHLVNSHISVSYHAREAETYPSYVQHLIFYLPRKKTIRLNFYDSQFTSCTIDGENVVLSPADCELAVRILWAIEQNL